MYLGIRGREEGREGGREEGREGGREEGKEEGREGGGREGEGRRRGGHVYKDYFLQD